MSGVGVVLCYHAVSDRWPLPMAVPPAQLERDVKRLLRRGWSPATFHDAVHAPPADRTFAVTFDDGFRSVHELALPILSRLGVPATIFVPTNYADSGAPLTWPRLDRWLGTEHEAELRGLSWTGLAELRAAGWEVGSHTRSHVRLSGLSDQELRRELRDSRLRCEERLGVACRSIAYPYGDHDPRVTAATRAAGYSAAAALDEPRGAVHGDPLRWPRVIIEKHRAPDMPALRSPWRLRPGGLRRLLHAR